MTSLMLTSVKKLLIRSQIRISCMKAWKSCSEKPKTMYAYDPNKDFWDDYRRKELKDPKASSLESDDSRKLTPYLVSAVGSGIGLYLTKESVIGLVKFMAMSQDVLALAQIEVSLDQIELGETSVFKWRGKPIFIKHRTPEEISSSEKVPLNELRDPEKDSDRVKDPNWLIVIGVCTHLGCIPIANSGDYLGGFYCPCHGSHYDASGRIRKGPAPLNLEVPPYNIQDLTVTVG